MGIFNRKKDDYEHMLDTSDTLIVFADDTKTSDIKRVTEISGEAVIAAGYYKVPLHDCEITTGPEGRVFFYRAPSRSVVETERLAKLEFNTVLTQITAYKAPVMPSSLDWTKGLLVFLLFVAIIVAAF